MAREIPELVRAAAGLAATVLDEARKLPATLPGLPVRLIGLALQRAMQIQQQYAGLVARGDELFTGIRGENEPGLATFDDDDDQPAPAPSGGFRESAFDRVEELTLDDDQSADELIEAQLFEAEFTDDPAVEAIVDEVEFVAVVVEDARDTGEVLAEEAPDTEALLEEVLDEVAIDDLVAEAPQAEIPLESVLPAKKPAAEKAAAEKAAPTKQAAAKAPAKKSGRKAAKKAAPSIPPLEQDEPPTLAPRGTVPAPAPAAPEAPIAPEGSAPAPTSASAPAPTPTPAPTPAPAPAPNSLAAPATPPIEGYDFFSLAQLRGHLRGYAAPTVEQLLAYEQAGLAREPYLRMLRNRLERLRSESA